jgi:hypothetical protein
MTLIFKLITCIMSLISFNMYFFDFFFQGASFFSDPGASFFSTLGLESAYMQLRIREEDQFKTSFRVPGGQYEFRVGTFDFVQVYCDNILNFSKTREEHLVHVRMVLETLLHHKLYAKASKCQFSCASVGFLGHFISEHGVAVDPRKVAAVAEWAMPTSCTDVCRFVGLANYYHKFVLRFSALAAPFTALCSPRATFRWGPAEQTSFDALKTALVLAPVLRVWDPARPTRLLTDASELVVSAILEQPDCTVTYHLVAFESRKLTPPERLYPQHLLELLAVVHALKTLRPYLLEKALYPAH